MGAVQAALEGVGYLADEGIATTVFLADALEKPLLVEGPAGVGKTELARAWAAASGRRLVRLQCYEGLDEAKALYEWAYPKQLLYTQVLRERIGEVLAGAESLAEAVDRVAGLEEIFFSERFLLPRPLLESLRSERPTVLLVDEVDKADPEFEAFLLELLAEFQVTIPELGPVGAVHVPRVVLTSNNAREMSDALKRRCLHLFIDFPSAERELAILRRKVEGLDAALAEAVVDLVQELRTLELKKAPSISETIDWAKALLALGAEALHPELVDRTLDVVLKYEGDLEAARTHLERRVRVSGKGA
ncbi:MAG: MoxR family ATPase [Deltaproteobacteria bacterium]|nr:MAG: MoxR family ATPase [Deltaproteobacteria bacterium]